MFNYIVTLQAQTLCIILKIKLITRTNIEMTILLLVCNSRTYIYVTYIVIPITILSP